MRKLVTIRKVKSVDSIPKADRIERVTVDGWTCVATKGQFEEGDYGVYFEIDSFLDIKDSRFSFLAKSGTSIFDGVEGVRVRTQKMRGQISQGLFMPVSSFPEIEEYMDENNIDLDVLADERVDLYALIGVKKFERPAPVEPGSAGPFPVILRATSEERVQNIYDDICDEQRDVLYYPTLKLDGMSCTIATVTEKEAGYVNDNTGSVAWYDVAGQRVGIIVCSHGLQMQANGESVYVKALRNSGMFEKMIELHAYFNRPMAVEGEVMGPGINGNPENLSQIEFFAFGLFDINHYEHMDYAITRDVLERFGVQQVPMIGQPFYPFSELGSLEEMLSYADGPSLTAKKREGVVFKSSHEGSFKVISNKWLLDEKNA